MNAFDGTVMKRETEFRWKCFEVSKEIVRKVGSYKANVMRFRVSFSILRSLDSSFMT